MAWRSRRLPNGQGVEGTSPKYLSGVGEAPRLFNTDILFEDHDCVALVEGEMDVVVLAEHGIPAVGVPGVQSWGRHFRHVLEDVPRLVVLGDGDAPGREFAGFLAREIGARVIDLPDSEDVGSLVAAGFSDFVIDLWNGATK